MKTKPSSSTKSGVKIKTRVRAGGIISVPSKSSDRRVKKSFRPLAAKKSGVKIKTRVRAGGIISEPSKSSDRRVKKSIHPLS